jgi:2-iminobutanoate/2-iminopropanoate deaminase
VKERQIITSEKLEAVVERHAPPHAILTGNTLWVSGQVARDVAGRVCHKRNFLGQLDMVLGNLKNVVETAGGTLNDVVKLTVYCRHLWDLSGMLPVYDKYFGDHRPAMTAVEVVQLWHPHFLVEIEAVAVLGAEQTIIGN